MLAKAKITISKASKKSEETMTLSINVRAIEDLSVAEMLRDKILELCEQTTLGALDKEQSKITA